AALLAVVETDVLVYHDTLRERVYAALLDLPSVRHLVAVGEPRAAEGAVPDHALEDLINGASPIRGEGPSADDLLVWCTGGTTGMPKGVEWHQGTLLQAGLVAYGALEGSSPPASLAEVADRARERQARGVAPVVLLTSPLVHA